MSRPILLIHGAWHGAWAFEPVVGPLKARGFSVEAVDLPLAGVSGDIAAARDLIAEHPGAVVLGHSYGGLVITHAAIGEDVSHLVYLAAMMPDEGEEVRAGIESFPPTALQGAMAPQEDGRIAVDPELSIEAFYHDCDPDEAWRAAAELRPMRMDVFPVLEARPAWRSLPSTYVICSDDRALHPDLQRMYAGRASHSVEWDVAHSPFLAQPERVVSLLADLAG